MGTKELEKKSSGGGLVAAWKQNPLVSTGLVLILMIVVQTAIMIYNFGEGSVGELMLSLLTNWLNILRNNAPVGIIALGMTFVIISGGIDLSVGSTLVAVGAMVMMVVDGSATGLLAGMGITGVPAYIIAIAVGLVFGGKESADRGTPQSIGFGSGVTRLKSGIYGRWSVRRKQIPNCASTEKQSEN